MMMSYKQKNHHHHHSNLRSRIMLRSGNRARLTWRVGEKNRWRWQIGSFDWRNAATLVNFLLQYGQIRCQHAEFIKFYVNFILLLFVLRLVGVGQCAGTAFAMRHNDVRQTV